MMTMNFVNRMFILMLSVKAVTSVQKHNSTEAMVVSTMTEQESTSLSTPSGVTKPITRASVVDGHATTSRNELFLQTSPTLLPRPLPLINLTTASTSQTSQPESSTIVEKSTSSITSMAPSTISMTSQANDVTTTGYPPTVSSSTQSQAVQDTEKMSTSDSTTNMTTQSFTSPTKPTSTSSTTPTSTQSQSTNSVTTIEAKQSTGLFKTSKATTQKTFVSPTKAKERQDTPKNTSSDGKVVAGIIGGALVLMMIGFLVILGKKRKLHRQQITTSDWAGPSPFLDGGANNGPVALRSSNRISLTSFLPQRLSRRLSLLQETEEEMEDMTPVSTFGNQGNMIGQEVDGDVKGRNGTVVIKDETKNNGETKKTAGEKETETEPQTKDQLATKNNSEDAKISQDPPDASMTQSGTEENAPVQLGNSNGQLK